MENDKQFNNLRQKVKVKLIILASSLVFVSGCSILQPFQSSSAGKAHPARIAAYQGPYTVTGDADYPAALKRPLPDLQNQNGQDNSANQADGAITTLEQDTAASDDDTVANQPPANIWNRIRAGFELPAENNPRINRELYWYSHHQAYLNRVVERAQPYMHYIVDQLDIHHIPLEIALLPIVESAFQPFAYSHGRASGIWQFIPSTGRRYGLKQNWWYDGRRDVVASTQAAIKLLSNLHREFNNNWLLALAAYNSGGGIVEHAIRRNLRLHRPTGFFALDLPPETRYYVPKLLALKRIVADPAKYGVHLARIDDIPYFERVKVNSQIDLALAAKLAGMDLDDMYDLNPAFNRWATSPNGPSYLLIPVDDADTFKTNLADYPADQRIKWIRHRIHPGETISQVAMRYHTSIGVIRRVNHLHSDLLRAGHDLTIPIARRSYASYTLSANERRRHTQDIPHGRIKIKHIVQSGDTLWNLAHRHGVGVRQLARWNDMAPRDPLVPGQTIVIWSRHASRHARFISVDIKAPPRRVITRRIGYSVRRGDSLALISRKFNVTISQLLRWNRRIHRNRYLQPGQHITLYVDIANTSSTGSS